MTINLTPTTCPKWLRCNAPLCPLDTHVSRRVMLKGESVCFYLTEFVKIDSEAIFRGAGREELWEAIATLVQPMISRCAPLKRHLERATTTGSRMTRFTEAEVAHDEV